MKKVLGAMGVQEKLLNRPLDTDHEAGTSFLLAQMCLFKSIYLRSIKLRVRSKPHIGRL